MRGQYKITGAYRYLRGPATEGRPRLVWLCPDCGDLTETITGIGYPICGCGRRASIPHITNAIDNYADHYVIKGQAA
jgi:hypothetical protein